MSLLLSGVAQMLHILLMLAIAPLLVGLMRRFSARVQGMAGPPVLQPWHDIVRGFGRAPVVSEGVSWLWHAAPVARLSALAVAAALVPGFTGAMVLAPLADLLVVAGLLALARALAVLARMDGGTAPSGRLAALAAARMAFAEPALLLVAYGLALVAGGSNLVEIARAMAFDAPHLLPAAVPLALALLAVVAADGLAGGMPDAGGRPAAVAAAGDALRLLVWFCLVACLFLPPAPLLSPGMPGAAATVAATLGAWLLGMVAWAGKLVVLAAGTALAGAVLVRPAPRHDAGWLALAALLALLGVLLLFSGRGSA